MLLEQLKLFAPLLSKAQELEEYENLQKVILDILHLFQEVLDAIDKYSEKHLLGKLRSRQHQHMFTFDQVKYWTNINLIQILISKSFLPGFKICLKPLTRACKWIRLIC